MRILCLILLITVSRRLDAQCSTPDNSNFIKTDKGTEISLDKLGKSSIFLKDGTIKKNCYVTEIKNESIVYLKNKVLHDLLINKIMRIDSEESAISLYFTDEKKPLIRFTAIQY